jgi:outer membrane autotransporter protein
MAGLRLGWGGMVQDNIYLSAELEGSIPFTATNTQTALGTEFRIKSGTEFAGFGRLGWSPDGRNLLFVRAGAINLNRSLEAPQFNYQSGTDNELAPAFGIGAEVVVSDRVSFRLDLTHAKGSGATDLKIFQGAVGLTYRF